MKGIVVLQELGDWTAVQSAEHRPARAFHSKQPVGPECVTETPECVTETCLGGRVLTAGGAQLQSETGEEDRQPPSQGS